MFGDFGARIFDLNGFEFNEVLVQSSWVEFLQIRSHSCTVFSLIKLLQFESTFYLKQKLKSEKTVSPIKYFNSNGIFSRTKSWNSDFKKVKVSQKIKSNGELA